MSGVPAIDDAVQSAHVWLHEIDSRLGLDDRQKAWRLLRVSLHALRDRLPATEAAQLAAQLPTLIRGVFYEGWRPTAVPVKVRSREEFLKRVREAFSNDPEFDAEAAFREVAAVMQMHVSEGEMEDVRQAMPAQIRALFEEA